MTIPEWHEAIAQMEPHIFRITTPGGSGSGFLVSKSTATPLRVIATAAHVIAHAHYWEQPIRLHHFLTGKTVLLRPTDRAINIDEDTDTAGILFREDDEIGLPDLTLPLVEKNYHIKPGVQMGWLGFPAVSRLNLCFFSGPVSAYLEGESAYLVDGVAINGVSGGPAFRRAVDTAELVGVVSAYIPNRVTGDALPGVAVVRDVNRYHHLADRLKNLDEAKAQQTPPGEPPQAPPAPGPSAPEQPA
jgi:hypothetical protein